MKRFYMVKDLSRWHLIKESNINTISPSDYDQLGEVMYEAYKGTIDYSGETLEEAKQEIKETMNGKYGKIIQEACLISKENNLITSAIFFNWYEEKQIPLLTFSITRASHKGKGLAKKLLNSGLSKLVELGHKECCLFVTEGNEPAFSIYKQLGFRTIE